MRKTLIITIILASALANFSGAQEIPNSGFEDWILTQYFEEPDIFVTSNARAYAETGSPNVTKSNEAHSGNFAARLETFTSGYDTITGLVILGTADESGLGGGYPYTDRPDSVRLWAKFDIQDDDQAWAMLIFNKGSENIGMASITFMGSQNEYSEYIFPVEWESEEEPDTLMAIFASSSLGDLQFEGSTIYLDDIGFIGEVESFPNGNMEDWTMVEFEDPEFWFTFNFFSFMTGELSVTKSNDSYQGLYAVQIKSVEIMEDTMGFITNGYFGEEGPAGGMAVENDPAMVSGYYMYFPSGPDTAIAGAFTFRYDEFLDTTILVEESLVMLPPADEYTYFEIPLSYHGIPHVDTLNISFASGNFTDEGNYYGLGSILIIDDLHIEYIINNTEDEHFPQSSLICYPNPASNIIRFELISAGYSLTPLGINLQVINMEGSIVLENFAEDFSRAIQMDVSGLKSGTYHVILKRRNEVIAGTSFIKN